MFMPVWLFHEMILYLLSRHVITNITCQFCSRQNEQNLDKSNTEIDDEMPIKPGIGIYKRYLWDCFC